MKVTISSLPGRSVSQSGRDNIFSRFSVSQSVSQSFSQSGSHMCWAPQRFLLIYDFRHISFISPSVVFFISFNFITSRKVAMGLTVNNFWCVDQIPMVLYISGILGALCVQPYTNIKILTYISLIIHESVNFVKIVLKTVIFLHFLHKLMMFYSL